MNGSIAGTRKRAILSLRRLVRDVLPDSIQSDDLADDEPTDQVPALKLDAAGIPEADATASEAQPIAGPSSDAETDSVRRLAESTGVPVGNLAHENRQAAARQLEAELHQRLSRWIRLEGELAHQKVETEKLVSAMDASRLAVLSLEATVQRLTDESRDASRQIEALEAQLAAERSSARSTIEGRAALEEEARTLRKSLEEQSRRLASDGERLAAATAELQSYKDALLGLQATLSEQQSVTDRHEREKAALAAAVADVEAALADVRARQRADQDERDALRSKAKQYEATIASHQVSSGAEFARLERNLAERQGKVEDLERLLADRAASLVAADEQVKALHVREGQLLLRIEESEHELERRREEMESLAESRQKVAAERDHQRAVNDGLNEEIRRQKKLLQVLGSGLPNLDEIAATVSTLDAWVSSQGESASVPAAGEASAYRLIEELHGASSTKHMLDKDIFTIGRSSDCDLRVRGPYTSRQHARILNDSSGVVIEDLGSANGIEVNHERVESCVLHHGDIVEIGGTRFRYVERALA